MAIRRNRQKTVAVDGSAPQELPDDLVLEIVARCPTVADVIRCAATSKPLRRGILNKPFLRRLRYSLLRDGLDGTFIPSLLVGLYHKTNDPRHPLEFIPAADGAWRPSSSVAALPPAVASPGRHDAGACQYGSYLPVASGRSLLVLRRKCRVTEKEHLIERHGPYPVELSVCNPTSGERWVLPPHDVYDTSHAVLDADPLAPSAFKLLVAKLTEDEPRTLRVQILSSEDGDWGPVVKCRIRHRGEFPDSSRRGPVVLGDSVHWLCNTEEGPRILTWRWRGGVKPPRDASLVKLHKSCWSLSVDMMCLAASPPTDGAQGSHALLSLIVQVRGGIDVWVREKTGARSTWKLLHCIRDTCIPQSMGSSFRWLNGAERSLFCNRKSGRVFPRATDGADDGPLLINLDSTLERDFCPYEVDMFSYMLFGMKQL
ncbi:hypothetical protein EJB05_17699, partial [Eragrostis curvula]